MIIRTNDLDDSDDFEDFVPALDRFLSVWNLVSHDVIPDSSLSTCLFLRNEVRSWIPNDLVKN